MIDWKKHFDHIYCIHYLPYQNRYKKCLEEIVRVGIKDSGVFSWKITWDSPIFDKLYQVCNAAPSVGCMKVGFSHYMCIKEAYENEYTSSEIQTVFEKCRESFKEYWQASKKMKEVYPIKR